MAPTLLSHLEKALTHFPGSHSYTLQILRSQPRRSYALFPHASDLTTKIWQEEVLVVVSEEMDVPAPVVPSSTPSSEGTAALDSVVSPVTTEAAPSTSKRPIPILALEANIYTIPSTSHSLLYISKVDTTGLLPAASSSSNPTRTLVASFISYHLLHPPHSTRHIRVHIFARAQGQYLFPGSVENKGKRVLDDKGLIRWWKKTLEIGVEQATRRKGGLPLVATTETTTEERTTTVKSEEEQENPAAKCFYMIPGLAYLDSLVYVPSSSSSSAPSWTYGHPYSHLTSPLFPLKAQPTPLLLPDLIPSFPDDPKSRFLHSLTSSVIAPSGNPDDYDDLMASLHTKYLSSTGASQSKVVEIERERERERKRLIEGVEGGVEEWWERMQFRQECCSGTLVAFFVVAGDLESGSGVVEGGREGKERKDGGSSGIEAVRGAVPYAVFTKLWSQIHNVDYSWSSGPSKMADRVQQWGKDLENVVRAEGAKGHGHGQGKEGDLVELEVRSVVKVDNKEVEGGTKRGAQEDEKKVVNLMVPRKKKKVVV